MQKFQVYVYRDEKLIWISQPHTTHQAQSLASNWRFLGYQAKLRPVTGDVNVRICNAEPTDEVLHSRRLRYLETVQQL